ncbi:zf-HC2 domain-containing protein [bacterium]|nr:zf-HC2 domain-containing protein [bacterium]
MTKEKVGFSYQDVFPEKGSECNRQDDVFRYFENLLSDDEARSFEEHLKDCSSCAGLLADLDETNRASEATMIDASKADQIFSQTRAKLGERLGVPSRALHIPPPERRFHIPAYVNILLIGLVATLIYPSYKSFVLNNEVTELKKELSAEKSKSGIPQQEIESLKQNYEKQIESLNEERSKLLQPDLSGSAVYAVRTERSASSQVINVPFGQQQTFNLVFSVPGGDFKSYLVEISDDGKQIWQNEITVTPQADSPSALISINLKADYIKEGVYRLKISGIDKKNDPIQLDEFRLKVSHSA